MKRKILVSGSTGFVGKNLVPRLLMSGNDILEITRDISKSNNLFKDTTSKLFIGDNSFKDKIVAFKPEIVIHLASYLSPSDSWTDIEKLIHSNILFLSKILNAVTLSDIKLFVNTGSSAEYSKGDGELTPAYFYAATKTASRAIVNYYAHAYNFKQTTVVPYTIYGGKDSKKKIIDLIYDSTKSEKPIDLSPGNQILDFIHISDVIEFYINLINNEVELPNASTFMLGTGRGHTLKEVASLIEKITSQKTNINWGGKDYRKSDVMNAVARIDSHKQFFEWTPKICLKDGLTNYILNEKYDFNIKKGN